MDSYAKLGAKGVNLVKAKYTPDDQTVLSCQNAELVLDRAFGGRASLRKRAGYTDSGGAFASGIFEMFEIKFIEGADLTPDSGGGGFAWPGTIITGGNSWHDYDDPFTTPDDASVLHENFSGTPDDGTYIFSDAGAGDVSVGYRIETVDQTENTGHLFRVRALRASGTLDLRVRLGSAVDPDVVTKDFTLTGSFVTSEQSLTSGEMDSLIAAALLSDGQIYVEFEAIGSGGGEIQVSWFQWENPA